MVADATEGMILLDVTAGAGAFDRDLLERFGHAVRVCHGTEHGTLCPLLAGRGCSDFTEAHGVIFELDLDRPQQRAVVRRYRELARAEIEGWCRKRDLDPPPVSRCTLADLYAHAEGRTGIRRERGFGFTQVA